MFGLIKRIKDYKFKKDMARIDMLLERINSGDTIPDNPPGKDLSEEELLKMEKSCQNVRRYAENMKAFALSLGNK